MIYAPGQDRLCSCRHVAGVSTLGLLKEVALHPSLGGSCTGGAPTAAAERHCCWTAAGHMYVFVCVCVYVVFLAKPPKHKICALQDNIPAADT